jgi:hypothetical protein
MALLSPDAVAAALHAGREQGAGVFASREHGTGIGRGDGCGRRSPGGHSDLCDVGGQFSTAPAEGTTSTATDWIVASYCLA